MKSKNNPLLSICIPTRNREKYCIQAIRHILSYSNKNFELIVYDHSDSKDVENYVKMLNDSRLKYFYTTCQISSSENMSRSIQHASGKYVCMIGDDDTVLPNIFKWVEYMDQNNIDSLCPAYRPEYFWPDKENNINGILKFVVPRNLPRIEIVDPKLRLIKLFKSGIIQFPLYNLPRVYHGIIEKKAMDKIFERVGTYFAGLSPDIYSTVALSSIVQHHVVLNEACTIAGACPASATSKGRFNAEDGKFENAPHLKNNSDYQWNKLIPKYYCGETIWAESALRAATDFEMDAILKSFNRNLFNIASLAYNRHIKKIVLEAYFLNMEEKPRSIKCIELGLKSYIYTMIDLVKRAHAKFFFKKTYKFNGVVDISQTVFKLESLN